MKFRFIAAVAILVASAASAWSQEGRSDAVLSGKSVGYQSEYPPESSLGGDAYYLSHESGNDSRLWASADFLVWAIKQGNTPALVTDGALGPGTTTLFGGDLDYGTRFGGRFSAGYWLDCCRNNAIEANFLFLDGPGENYSVISDGTVTLARPFTNAITGLEDRQLIAVPGTSSGSIDISSGSQLLGAELNLLHNLCCCRTDCCDCCQSDCGGGGCGEMSCCEPSGHRIDLIAGFRYLDLEEDLVITEAITILPGAPAPLVPGDMISVTDRFETRNRFYGGQLGARGEWYRGCWFVNATGKVALGSTRQEVSIRGNTVFTPTGGAAVTQQGGLLALPTNIGDYERDRFTVVPEIGINVGRQLSENLRVYAGYTFIYWSSVVRPGDQIDPVVNPTQLPTIAGPGTLVGPARPAFAFQETDFWAQGLNLGMEYQW